METTSSLSQGNETTPEAAFIAWSALSAYTLTENVVPTACEPEGGEKFKVAACANAGTSANSVREKIIL